MMRTTWSAMSSAIAPVGVPYLLETVARAPGSRRSRAIAKVPLVDATAAPTYTASMSKKTTTSRTFSQNSDPDGDPGAPRANSGAPATSGLVITDRSNPNPATSADEASREKVDTITTAPSTALGIERFGSAVSSARFAAVSNPTKINTPYRTPKRIPLNPPEGDGSNALAMSLSPPRSAIRVMKHISTTTTDTSASVSCTRVEIFTPKYRTANRPSVRIASHIQIAPGAGPPSNRPGHRLSWMYPPIRTPRPIVRMIVPAQYSHPVAAPAGRPRPY